MNEENRKKILIGGIIGVVTLIIVVVGATYAFFSLNVSGDTINTNVDIETGNADVVSIEPGEENMHINLAVSDMAKDSPNKAYYATTVEEEDYKLNEGEGTLTFATITGTNKEENGCTAKVTITMDTSDNSMGKVLKNNDAILHLESGEYQEDIDLSTLLTEEAQSSVTKEIEVEISVSESNSPTIQGYLKINNTIEDQSYLAGKTLNITITVDNLVCGSTGSKGPLAPLEMLKAKGGETFAGGENHTTVVDEMYRYKGTAAEVTNNYICFGTDNTDTCKKTPKDYMYRIIGITDKEDKTINLPANSLKIIKATPSSESQKWHESDSENIKWDASNMKTYLNETFYNATFVEAATKIPNADYWESLILSHSWYNEDYTNIPDAEPKTSHTEASKIGLMYATDYKNAGPLNSLNWLCIDDGWSTNKTLQGDALYEWTMSRSGFDNGFTHVWLEDWWDGYGTLMVRTARSSCSVRPVFYLQSSITLTGEGNTENPFIIHSA